MRSGIPLRDGNGDRIRHALIALAALTVSLAAAKAHAACPPSAADGAILGSGELLLAYRPVLASDESATPGRIPMARHFTLAVQLCGKDGVSAARLVKADASMPEHKHGMNYRPVIAPQGGGRFRVAGMMFHMAGRWQLAFEVQNGKELVRLTHDVQID